ncbi:MAG TPA: NADP-dependent oxidoreductase [Rugosimonospora sp.]|nr:NADP-dependent oxidoreductase [Rugosimonospora sp.]
MRAIVQTELGGPEVLHLSEVDRPVPGPTEVLVRVRAAGVNPVDWKVRRGGGFLGTPPFTVGWDVSGEVVELGTGVTRFAPGDEVYGMPRFPREAAAYAEFVTAPSRHFARKPAALDHVGAAALPLAGLTAWQSLVDTAGIGPGQRVLVHAAAGGVGHLAVQIAKARGAYVLGTASAAKHEFVRGLGADEVIDYTSVDFAVAVRDVDVVLDTLGGEVTTRSLSTLRPGGILVLIVGAGAASTLAPAAAERGVRVAGLLVEPDHAGLAELSRLVQDGQLRPAVAATFPLAQAAQAHELGETNRTAGKIVLANAGW